MKKIKKILKITFYTLGLLSFLMIVAVIVFVDDEDSVEEMSPKQLILSNDSLSQVEKDSALEYLRVQDSLRERKAILQKQFSSWDGAHMNLKELIKENMNDASSFEHVETKSFDRGNTLFVVMKFRGKNAFGAKVLNVVNAIVDAQSGKVIQYEIQ